MTTAMHLQQFLTEAKTAEIELGLSQLAALKADNYIGTWDAETGFALVVEVIAGAPFQWHVRGPLSRDGAKTWLGIVRAEIQSGAELSRLMH